MFIRKITQKKNGENYNSYRLVESIRTEKGPRQRVLYLGADFNVPQDDWKILCGVLIEKLSKQPSLIQRVDTEFEVIVDGIFKNILHKHAKTTLPKGKEEIANDEPPDYQKNGFIKGSKHFSRDLNQSYFMIWPTPFLKEPVNSMIKLNTVGQRKNVQMHL